MIIDGQFVLESDGLPSRETLLQAFRLECDDCGVTGRIFHRIRPQCWFPSKASATIWNGRFSGTLACGKPDQYGRLMTVINAIKRRTHRVIYKMVYGGLCPTVIDHKDGNSSNNRPENLLQSVQLENCKNQRMKCTNTSGATGVRFVKRRNRWNARVTVNYQEIYLGNFMTFDEAVAARKMANDKYGFSDRHGAK